MTELSNFYLNNLKFLKSPLFVGLFLFGGFFFSGVSLQKQIQAAPRELAPPPKGLEHFHFGFRSAMADLFWVRALQDFDYCEEKKSTQLCKGNGWLFQTLDVITTLDSQFRMAYSAGGMALSILISDIEGASKLFDRAVQEFPDDWVLLYKAAYHALYEEKNTEKAADLMLRAARRGAPAWVYSLAGRLYSDAGKSEVAERLLSEMQNSGIDERVQERLRQKLQSAGNPHP